MKKTETAPAVSPAEAPAPAPAAPAPVTYPAEGGSYVRDPRTGELKKGN